MSTEPASNTPKAQTRRTAALKLAGWGNWPVETCRVYRPHQPREVADIVAAEASLIARGFGRSYGDASLNALGAVASHSRMNRMCSFDPDTRTLVCEAGVSIGEILRAFIPRGYTVPVTPGTQFVSVGGAIASDVHGKNHHVDGTFSAFVDRFTLLTANGSTLTCSRTENADAFRATVGGMGLTGIISRVWLRLLPIETAYVRVRTDRARDLDHVMTLCDELDGDYRYSVAWIDCTARRARLGRGILMHGEHAMRDDLDQRTASDPLGFAMRSQRAVPCFAPNITLNRLSVGLFNRTHYLRNRDGTHLERYDQFMYPLDRLAHWNRLYGRRGMVQYQCVLPEETAREGMLKVLDRVVHGGPTSFLAVLKRMGDANNSPLSFPMPGWTLAMDIPNTGNSLTRLAAELDDMVIAHGGRTYLSKDATLTPEAFRAMYPRIAEFRAIKDTLDPEGVFNSSLARRIGLTGEGSP